MGGPPEFEERFTGVPGLNEVYGLEFSAFRPLAAGSNLTAQSLANGQIDVANIFSTDPSISENDFVVLDDPDALFVAQNIVPLITTDAVNDEITTTLNGVSAELDTAILTELLAQVVVGGEALRMSLASSSTRSADPTQQMQAASHLPRGDGPFRCPRESLSGYDCFCGCTAASSI
ncbi:hypothetical protein L0A91_10790 [Ornithinimicrobium sp. INDO-MA30-4]|nr:hypothetical protein L0A91_10790 [Ornithinimicrobium sp. INDO-MA30-4]